LKFLTYYRRGVVLPLFLILFMISAATYSGAAAFQTGSNEESAAAEANAETLAALTGSDPSSKATLNYEGWDRLLSHAVETPDELNRDRHSRYESSSTGSRIGGGRRSFGPIYEVNMVNYSRLGENFRGALGELLDDFAEVQVASLNPDEQLAFWLNLHNAAFLAALVDRYPIEHLEDLMKGSDNRPGLLDATRVKVDGTNLTLRQIREDVLDSNWPSPLVIYGLFSGSEDGPNMSQTAYTGKNVYDLLAASAREFINSDRGVKFLGSRARVSEIYQWPGPRFKNRAALITHLRKYAASRSRSKLRRLRTVGHLGFDWKLNDLPGDTPGSSDSDLEGYHPPPLVNSMAAD